MFNYARPIWPERLEQEMNCTGGFRAQFQGIGTERRIVRITASSRYRVYVNGHFCGHGPAAGPHAHYRVDEWELSPSVVQEGSNIVAIEVAGYNVNSFYTLDQPSFVQAEVEVDGIVVAATGDSARGFDVFVLPERVQKVQRYSFQRAFIEAYQLDAHVHEWRTNADSIPASPAASGALMEEKQLLPRRVSYSDFAVKALAAIVASGTVAKRSAGGADVNSPWRDRALTGIGPLFKGFEISELALLPTDELGELETSLHNDAAAVSYEGQPLQLGTQDTVILAFDRNLSGFIGIQFTCERASRIAITFDEILLNGDVDHLRLECSNVIHLACEPGTYAFESIEPYTLKYMKIIVLEGDCLLSGCSLREYANPDADRADFRSSDEALGSIFDAARESFRQNAVDIFMDCPSRERAGWLCDSFFTARVEADLTGRSVIEHNFLENFALPEHFAHLPEGMLPMCYPADHYSGEFIPNWSLWFIIQLEEFRSRGGDEALIRSLQPRVDALLRYFEGFHNEFGLLENLESWVFIEWSKANSFVSGINFPSNMLYAGALEAAGRLYQNDDYLAQGVALKQVIREFSFDGEFFVDQAIENADGEIEMTDNRTEVCQYYAAFFGIADAETQHDWYASLVHDFSPSRGADEPTIADISDIHPANAFIGYYLRMELLSQLGASAQLLEEIKAFFGRMAEQTGTLWEHNRTTASCNHGFASHVVRSLYRDALGIESLDLLQNKLLIAFTNTSLQWCSGKLPTPEGLVELEWRIENGELRYRLSAPTELTVEVRNFSGKLLVREE
ncbi:family 78 glycoside hydrolase catalytic domain [Paenibacillus sp. CF384]|uniref:alpha-L-rhamnosidase-related protein n=1 Tax=Paenibacillus sp. CF384 TaxID=1884382 RepID=UPI00089A1F80|nr:family 78 glycoside hydrolase catalytic domain [Paenibacillus sp. CF384]SDX33296.1 alpha-L-rhamnosidase [Paenibacillus sp. CF384]